MLALDAPVLYLSTAILVRNAVVLAATVAGFPYVEPTFSYEPAHMCFH